jgi:hypothetical protein
MTWTTFKRIRDGVLTGLLVVAAALGAGCKNKDSSESGFKSEGEVLVGLTDAQGDFVSYTVDVKSITLTKANGAVVETMPLTTTVDFAQYTDMTEFLTAASVPNGTYVAAKMVLDYSNADIQVEDANGDAIKAAHVVDSDGKAIDELEVSIKLEGRNRLTIVPGVPASLTLDFDLAASNTVSFDSNGDATVTVEPMLLADIEPHQPKIHRVRGALGDVDTAGSSFDVVVRPFAHSISGNERRFGTLKVITDADTVYEIDGQPYDGAAGLAAMDALTQFTAVVAIGDLKFNPRRFVAREVYAGSSVTGGTLDVVTGNVIKRVGDVLTVRGMTLIRAQGSVIFRDNVEVTVADTTKVRKQRSKDAQTIDAISVGQRVIVHGTLTDSAAGSLALDASSGAVRMVYTKVRATVVTASPLVVNVESIDAHRIGLFDFAGTGADAGSDADSAAYEIDSGTLDTSALEVGAPVKVLGFVTPFGSAPPDFEAQTITDVTDVRASLLVVWQPPTAAPTSMLSSTSIALNLDGSLVHAVARAGVVTDLSGTAPVLVPATTGHEVFLIKYNRAVQLYTTFASFTTGLQDRLGAGAKVAGVFGRGAYDDATTTLESNVIAVQMR